MLNEIRRADPSAAQRRQRYVESLPILQADDQERAISRLSRDMGFEPPTIVTPEELMEP
jgi:hypothetical protein